MIIRALLAMAFAALAAVSIAGNASPPASITASYDVYQNGLSVAVMQEAFERDGARYRIISERRPTGLLELFIEEYSSGPRRLGYVVQLRPLAVFDNGMAGPDCRFEDVLSWNSARDRVRHHLFLGGANDDVRTQIHE